MYVHFFEFQWIWIFLPLSQSEFLCTSVPIQLSFMNQLKEIRKIKASPLHIKGLNNPLLLSGVQRVCQ